MPPAASARILANVKVLEHDRVAELQHFRIGQSCIGHVGMHGVGAVKTGAGGRTGADGFVILVSRISEVQIVHAALCCSKRAERSKQAVRHGLGSFDIACNDGCGEVPVKSTVASRFCLSTVIFTLMTVPWSISYSNDESCSRSMTRRTLSA